MELSTPVGAPPDIRFIRTARLVGLTTQAQHAIGGDFIILTRFPYRVGRESRSILTRLSMSLERRAGSVSPVNDLYLVERGTVVHVSREHFLIDVMDDGFILVDRGSVCGTIVAGRQVGGDRRGGRAALRDNDTIIVGTARSPFVFRFRAS